MLDRYLRLLGRGSVENIEGDGLGVPSILNYVCPVSYPSDSHAWHARLPIPRAAWRSQSVFQYFIYIFSPSVKFFMEFSVLWRDKSLDKEGKLP